MGLVNLFYCICILQCDCNVKHLKQFVITLHITVVSILDTTTNEFREVRVAQTLVSI